MSYLKSGMSQSYSLVLSLSVIYFSQDIPIDAKIIKKNIFGFKTAFRKSAELADLDALFLGEARVDLLPFGLAGLRCLEERPCWLWCLDFVDQFHRMLRNIIYHLDFLIYNQ
jgi:hypothetical protein